MRRALPFLAIALGLGLLGQPAASDPRDSFRRAIAATDRKDWAEAATLLRQALREQAEDTGEPVKIYGVRFVPYLPHLYLGLALEGLGDCPGALAEWEASERQGKMQRTAQLRLLREGRERCRAAARAPARVPAEGTAKAAPAEPPPASPPPAAAAPQDREGTLAEAKPQPVPPRNPEEAVGEPPAALPSPGSGPSQELRTAARALWNADYPAVIRLLGTSRPADRQSRATTHLLLAAARYGLYLRGGEGDAALLRAAAESVRECRRADPRLRPPARWFSPRFVEFFAATR